MNSYILAAVLPGFLAIMLAVVALKALPAATYGTLAYLEPITVIILGWLLFDQSLNLLQMSGGGLIIVSGVVQAALSQREPGIPVRTLLLPRSRGISP